MTAVDLYRTMRLIRRFEERAIELVRSGDIVGGIHPCIGQEAVPAGVCAALGPDDLVTGTHRGHGHVLAKGADPCRRDGQARTILDIASPERPAMHAAAKAAYVRCVKASAR